MQVAQRIAEERGSILGQEVGYAIRFENCTNPDSTRIKVFSWPDFAFLKFVVEVWSDRQLVMASQVNNGKVN